MEEGANQVGIAMLIVVVLCLMLVVLFYSWNTYGVRSRFDSYDRDIQRLEDEQEKLERVNVKIRYEINDMVGTLKARGHLPLDYVPMTDPEE